MMLDVFELRHTKRACNHLQHSFELRVSTKHTTAPVTRGHRRHGRAGTYITGLEVATVRLYTEAISDTHHKPMQ